DAGQVDSDHLPVVVRRDPADRAAGGLRTVRDDRDLLAHQPVQQGRLPDVRPSGERNEPGTRHSDATIRSWSASISPASASWSYPQRCSTPWTTASIGSLARAGQTITSPSSRGPLAGAPPSTGNDRTSVAASRSRC